VYAGGYVVTEANVRVTGGTYLEKLARRLWPGESPVCWRSDGRRATSGPGFGEAVARLRAAGLDDPGGDVRAVLVTDSCDLDGKWRYLVAGRDPDLVADAERAVEELLGI